MSPTKSISTQLVFKSEHLSSLFLEMSAYFSVTSLRMDDIVIIYDHDSENYLATAYVEEY